MTSPQPRRSTAQNASFWPPASVVTRASSRVPGEEREQVYHRLYSPRKYKNENILVVGGGNSAIEAAVTLSEQNKVYLSYRGSEIHRAFKENKRKTRSGHSRWKN